LPKLKSFSLETRRKPSDSQIARGGCEGCVLA
jgi:hypothetical protein